MATGGTGQAGVAGSTDVSTDAAGSPSGGSAQGGALGGGGGASLSRDRAGDHTTVIAFKDLVDHALPESTHATRVAPDDQAINHAFDHLLHAGTADGNPSKTFIGVKINRHHGHVGAAARVVGVSQRARQFNFIRFGANARNFHRKPLYWTLYDR